MTPQQSTDISRDFDRLRKRIGGDDFLNNRGLANEVGFYVFPYDASKELEVRQHTADLVADSESGALSAHVIERNLWQVFLKICEDKKILDKIAALEQKRGSDALLARLQKIATPEVYVRAMDYNPHQPGRDVLLITGVGQIYPFMRAHSILENAQGVFEDIPVVLMYPGRYDGQHLHLFDRIDDGNYYRAFNIL
ncbi:DUF1788 domain-containing protein [Enorma phocaeensis]|uniref:DUF1788 domain-containing protein n=1 Tax=Enorma phocaeensis TaxID=1871019 RepID=UPI002353AB63|nr:DUF1788 domain-containing protein [Enorma phocaeensis]